MSSSPQHKSVDENKTLTRGDANSPAILLLSQQTNHQLSSNDSIPNLDNLTAANNSANSNNITSIPENNAYHNNNKLTDSYINLLTAPKMDNFADIFSICCSTAVICGSLVPYIPQYLKIQRSLSADGFSTYVCLTLLLANILRIMFWFGHPFELPLLIQSFVVVAGMLALMEICVRVKNKSSSYIISSIGGFNQARRRRRFLTGSGLQHFWDWDDYFSYIKFLSLFTLLIGTLTYLLLNNYLFIEGLGFVALFTESMLGMPQLIRNYSKRSTRGMSVDMVIMWLSGDLFKTLYFIVKKAPIQFYVCGSTQVIVDILILGQVLWFKQRNVTYRKLPKST